MNYPHINPHLSDEEIFEHFTLTRDELCFLSELRKERNVLGFAVLLKTFVFLGYPPRDMRNIPSEIISRLSQQLQLNPEEFENYRWKGQGVDRRHEPPSQVLRQRVHLLRAVQGLPTNSSRTQF